MKQRSNKGKQLAGWLRALLALFLVGALSFCGLFACVMHGAYDHIQGEPGVMVILAVRCAGTGHLCCCGTGWMRLWTIWRITRT